MFSGSTQIMIDPSGTERAICDLSTGDEVFDPWTDQTRLVTEVTTIKTKITCSEARDPDLLYLFAPVRVLARKLSGPIQQSDLIVSHDQRVFTTLSVRQSPHPMLGWVSAKNLVDHDKARLERDFDTFTFWIVHLDEPAKLRANGFLVEGQTEGQWAEFLRFGISA